MPRAAKAAPAKKTAAAKVPTQRASKAAAPEAEFPAPTTDPRFDQFIAALAELVGQFGGTVAPAPAKATPAKKAGKAAPVEEPEDEDDEDEAEEDEGETDEEESEFDREERKAELESMPLAKLRKIATDLDQFEDDDIKAANKASLVKNILDAEEEAFGAEDEAEDEEADDDEGYEREALAKMTLAQVKKIAVDEFGFDIADLRGYDKDSVIDLIMEEQGEETEESDEEDEEEGEGEDYTREELEAMSDAQLRALHKEYEGELGKLKRGTSRDDIIDALMSVGEEADEEDEDE